MSKHIFIDKHTRNEISYDELSAFYDKYYISKIKLTLYNQIEKNPNIRIYIFMRYLSYFEDTLEYYNNIITFNCNEKMLDPKYINGYYISIEINNNCYVGYKFIEMELYQPKIIINRYIYRELQSYDTFKDIPYSLTNFTNLYESGVIIVSNYFKTFHDLVCYIMEISDMSYENSVKYLLKNKKNSNILITYSINDLTQKYTQLY